MNFAQVHAVHCGRVRGCTVSHLTRNGAPQLLEPSAKRGPAETPHPPTLRSGGTLTGQEGGPVSLSHGKIEDHFLVTSPYFASLFEFLYESKAKRCCMLRLGPTSESVRIAIKSLERRALHPRIPRGRLSFPKCVFERTAPSIANTTGYGKSVSGNSLVRNAASVDNGAPAQLHPPEEWVRMLSQQCVQLCPRDISALRLS